MLTAVPLDILAEIVRYLECNDVATLLATFSSRLTFGLTKLGLSRVIRVSPSASASSSYLCYMVSLSTSVEEAVFSRQSEVSLQLIRHLSARSNLHSLTIDGVLGDVKRFPRLVIGASEAETLAEEALLPLSCARVFGVHLPRLDLLFPSLSTLIVTQPLSHFFNELEPSASQFSGDANSCDSVVLQFASLLPRSLTTFHYVDHMQCSKSMTTFIAHLPRTLTELVLDFESTIGARLLNTCSRLSGLARLRLYGQAHLNTIISPLDSEYSGEPLLNLKEFEVATLHRCRQSQSLQGRVFSFLRMPHLEILSFTYGTSFVRGLSGVTDVNLAETLPPRLRELRLFRVPPPETWPISVYIAALPISLTSLTVSTHGGDWGNAHFIALLKPLVLLQKFVEICPTRKLASIDWSAFPDSLTHLELTEFGISKSHIFEEQEQMLLGKLESHIPKSLTFLRCPVDSLESAHWFTSKRPDCFLRIAPVIHLNADDSAFLMQRGLCENGTVRDANFARAISDLLGAQCQADWAFQLVQPRAKYAEQQRLPFDNSLTSLSIASVVSWHGLISFDSTTFSMSYISHLQTLTSLDLDTRMEIQANDLPPNLTYLHLRNTVLHNTLISAIFNLASLRSVRAHGKLANGTTPKCSKKWRILDVPDLVVPFRRFSGLCGDDLEELCCKTSGASDAELCLFVQSWPLAKRIELSCSGVVITGALIDLGMEYVDYEALENSVTVSLPQHEVIVADSMIRSLVLPEGVKTLDLDCSKAKNMKGELFAALPSTLTSAHIRNTGFGVDWKNLVFFLPRALTFLCVQPACGSHMLLDFVPDLPNLKTLRLLWPQEGDAVEVVKFSISKLTSLVHLELQAVKLEEKLHQATENMKWLETISLCGAEDAEAKDICERLEKTLTSFSVDTLLITGHLSTCNDEPSLVDWEAIVVRSLRQLPTAVRATRVKLKDRISLPPGSLRTISLQYESISSMALESKLEEAQLQRSFAELERQISVFSFFALPSPLPASLVQLTLSTKLIVPAPWVQVVTRLATAPLLEYVHLEMELDFSADPPVDQPPALKSLTTLHMPKATNSKKEGVVLHLPPTLTELVAPDLRLNPHYGAYPDRFSVLEVFNSAVVKRHLSTRRESSWK